MIHRGPDDAGEWWSLDRRVGLAYRRLAIIDITSAGHQPMHDATKALTIIFNGEIYNIKELQQELTGMGHSFHSQSDTEVIIAAFCEWGTDCLSRLNGMYAFALHDAREQSVFLARDRAGEKPLFSALNKDEFFFASELKVLIVNPAFPRRIDPEALDCYLAMGYVPGERCIVQGANKLPPAHALLFNCTSARIRVWRYWNSPLLDAADTSGQIEEGALLNELETLLEDSVRRQLVADVPVGVLLSGGVDSSLITAMAARASNRVKTFTVGFSGFGKYDETEHARLVAQHFGTDHIELQAGDASPDLFLWLARQFDEPVLDSSMIPTCLVSQLVRQHCTVALGGDGGDELFGGYINYNRLLWMQQKFGWIPVAVGKAISRSASFLMPVGSRGRIGLQGLGFDLHRGLPLAAAHFDANTRQQLLGLNAFGQSAAERIRAECILQTSELLQRATRMDFENYMAVDILVKVDRTSMLNSLEIRAPLLDYRIIEFAFGRVPWQLKATVKQCKVLLKRLAARVLPPEFDQQRKRGFAVLLSNWLKAGPWRDMFHHVLLDRQCSFDKKVVTGLLQGQDLGKRNSERLFGLVLFELWRREYQGLTL